MPEGVPMTIAPERLHEIRKERRPDSRYAALDNCRFEVDEAEVTFWGLCPSCQRERQADRAA